ncbi:MAG: RNA polymerase sigma-70 factor [Bacteroidota bacterium]
MFLSKRNQDSDLPDIRTTLGFTVLYETYVDYVFDTAYKYLGDENSSENITAELFSSVWERRNVLYNKGLTRDSWKYYLTKAVKNKIYDHLRSHEQSERYLTLAKRDFPFHENTTEKEVEFEQLAEQIRLAINQLPPKCQQVFRLSRENGLSNKEIAKKLEITNHAVKRHIAIALAKLREYLSEYVIPKRATGS